MNDPYMKASSPPTKAWPIVPHATNPLAPAPEWIYVNQPGDVTCRPVGSAADVTFKGLLPGLYLPVAVTHIRVAGTTATLVGLSY